MIYVTSDWHGYSPDGIKSLLSEANFGENDFLYVLGDVVDRGDHAAELFKLLLYAPNIVLCCAKEKVDLALSHVLLLF